jgi:hypothetical protein
MMPHRRVGSSSLTALLWKLLIKLRSDNQLGLSKTNSTEYKKKKRIFKIRDFLIERTSIMFRRRRRKVRNVLFRSKKNLKRFFKRELDKVKQSPLGVPAGFGRQERVEDGGLESSSYRFYEKLVEERLVVTAACERKGTFVDATEETGAKERFTGCRFRNFENLAGAERNRLNKRTLLIPYNYGKPFVECRPGLSLYEFSAFLKKNLGVLCTASVSEEYRIFHTILSGERFVHKIKGFALHINELLYMVDEYSGRMVLKPHLFDRHGSWDCDNTFAEKYEFVSYLHTKHKRIQRVILDRLIHSILIERHRVFFNSIYYAVVRRSGVVGNNFALIGKPLLHALITASVLYNNVRIYSG